MISSYLTQIGTASSDMEWIGKLQQRKKANGKCKQQTSKGHNVIYIVSGYKRSGTSLMMKILDHLGLELDYDVKFSCDVIKNGNFKQKYVFEIKEIVYGQPFELEKFEGKVIKVLASGVLSSQNNSKNIKMIYMSRDKNEILNSMRKYKNESDMKREKNIISRIPKNKIFKVFNPLEVNFIDLINAPKEIIMDVIDYLDLKPTTLQIECAISEVNPEMNHFS